MDLATTCTRILWLSEAPDAVERIALCALESHFFILQSNGYEATRHKISRGCNTDGAVYRQKRSGDLCAKWEAEMWLSDAKA